MMTCSINLPITCPFPCMHAGHLSISVDAFSFGILMWEVLAATHVFGDLSDAEVMAAVVIKRARPPFPPDAPAAYRALACRCWADDPDARPSMEDVVKEITFMQRSLCPEVRECAQDLDC